MRWIELYKKYRFGMIVPSPNVVIEPEFYSFSTQDIGFYTSRVLLNDCTSEQLKKMGDFSERAALELSTARVNAILYACTSGSLINGLEWEKNLAHKLSKVSGVPAITTFGSVKEALQFMNISKIHMFTPYIDEINKKEKHILEKSGFKVLSSKGLNITNAVEIAEVEPEFILNEAVKLYRQNSEAQAIFLSCTNLRTFSIIDQLEKQTRIPVITSNQASLWGLLRLMKIEKSITGIGKLFNHDNKSL